MEETELPIRIPLEEIVVRERMRADLAETGDFCMMEIYARMAPNLTVRALRHIKKELLDEYLAQRHQHFTPGRH